MMKDKSPQILASQPPAGAGPVSSPVPEDSRPPVAATAGRRGFCIGLTGGIACGKSTVAGFFRRWGAEIVEADEWAHALLAPGGSAVEPVLRDFGAEVRAPDGGVDRHRLAQIVFADPAARRRLEALLHPPVIARLRTWKEHIRQSGRRGVAVVPLLYEVGLENDFDAVVCVVADENLMRRRLAQRGLSAEEARARIASQQPVAAKAARADYVIENNGSLAELEKASRAIWMNLEEQGE